MAERVGRWALSQPAEQLAPWLLGKLLCRKRRRNPQIQNYVNRVLLRRGRYGLPCQQRKDGTDEDTL